MGVHINITDDLALAAERLIDWRCLASPFLDSGLWDLAVLYQSTQRSWKKFWFIGRDTSGNNFFQVAKEHHKLKYKY